MAKTVLRLVAVSDGFEVGQLELHPDGTVATTGLGTAAAILRHRMLDYDESEVEAFHGIAKDGWSNGNVMIALD